MIIRTVYIQRQNSNDFLQSNGSISRTSYFRILALGCLDIVITLPISIINLVSFFITLEGPSSLPAYIGWDTNHADFEPFGIPYADITDTPWDSFTTYFDYGQYAVLAIAIFALFGMTSSARSAYWSRITLVGRLVGWKQPSTRQQHSSLMMDSIAFAAPSHPVNLPQREGLVESLMVAPLLTGGLGRIRLRLRVHPRPSSSPRLGPPFTGPKARDFSFEDIARSN